MNIPKIQSFDQFLSTIEQYGNAPAVAMSDGQYSYTYTTLATTVRQWAALLSKKIKPGERVLLTDLHGPHWVIAFFAVVLNKGIAVPIDHRMSPELQREIQVLVDPTLVITCNSKSSQNIPTMCFEAVEIIAARTWKAPSIESNTPAEIIFTSGTWGKPKGVTLSHNNLLANTWEILQVHTPKTGSVFLSVLPLSHAYEQVPGLLCPLFQGSSIVYQASLDSFSLIESMQLHKPHYMVVVPRFLDLLERRIYEQTKRIRLAFKTLLAVSSVLPRPLRRYLCFPFHARFGGRLHTFTIGGAPLATPTERVFQSLGFQCIVGYGLSESSPVLTISNQENRPENCVGKALSEVSIRTGTDGEIIAQGPNIFLGYWPLTEPFVTTLYTGDLGYLDDTHRLFITGRKKNMIVFPTGDKIQLEDIESIADALPSISESCALALEIQERVPKLGIVYVGTMAAESVLHQVNAKLPLFARLHFAKPWSEEKLPRSHLLKLQRKIIQEQYEKI